MDEEGDYYEDDEEAGDGDDVEEYYEDDAEDEEEDEFMAAAAAASDGNGNGPDPYSRNEFDQLGQDLGLDVTSAAGSGVEVGYCLSVTSRFLLFLSLSLFCLS